MHTSAAYMSRSLAELSACDCKNVQFDALLVILLTMLDSFEILTTSGVVLWSKSYAPVSSSIINGFIKDVFIEEKVLPGASVADDASATQNPTYKRDQFTLKWASVKDLGLIFVVGSLGVVFERMSFVDPCPRQSTSRFYI